MTPTSVPSALPSISEYTLLEFLGEGATAQVYLAQHEASGAHVAIEVIDKLLIVRSQPESKVQQEFVLHAELRLPHVLHVHSVFEDARNYYMLLEYCARRSLEAMVKTLPHRQMDEQRVKQLFRQVVEGVVYLHVQGVIHRDLKLANLLLNEHGDVKISDFGLAGRLGETLENVANARQTPLVFPHGFSSGASDLIKRLLSPNPQDRPSAQQILLHPWLRDPSQKRVPSQGPYRRKYLASRLPHARVSLDPPERVRKSRIRRQSTIEESSSLASSSSPPVPVLARRRRILGDTPATSKPCGLLVDGPSVCLMPSALDSSSSDSSANSDVDSAEIKDALSKLSELSLSTFSSHDDKPKQETKSTERTEKESPLEVSRKSDISVILHLELQDETLFGIFYRDSKNVADRRLQLQWSCKASSEIGRSPTFVLKLSNGWDVCYDPAVGEVISTTPECNTLRYGITGAGGARRDSKASSHPSRSRLTHGVAFPPLVRFCQCLALRTMPLRQIALRGAVSKLPYIHYDSLPSSLVASFRSRASLLNHGFQCLNHQDMATEHLKNERRVDIAGVSHGDIDENGDLRVVFVDGARLVLAASGLQVRFRPPWSTNARDETDTQDGCLERARWHPIYHQQ
ncbi:hypothetical protein PsorP6_001832 [Peronosclerospora sorghi]|uniref:Uncharacterized protein n=1 Tax=Peronosclerospora sorghi TaxID=230839 RepID=A0ACC0WV59_9STRA|nr:hypothetical protein PsorP6_001832 [Peronosclerospora sorghi]